MTALLKYYFLNRASYRKIHAVLIGNAGEKLCCPFWEILTRDITVTAGRCQISSDDARQAPLTGLKVLDITRILAGPYCTMLLGDLGAEIIKVEKPGSGDDTRHWGPPWVGKDSAYYCSINRNKNAVCIDFKKPEGAEIVRKLACHCDVLVENYVPGKLSELNLGYEQMRKINPRLIYVSISGFGQTGPYSQYLGFDNVVAAVGGLMHITGPQNGEPCRVGVAVTDLSTGLYATIAVMAALLHRTSTNQGQHIDCNLLSTQIATLTHIASSWLNGGIEGYRWGTGHPNIVPYQAFKTKDDRYMMIGAGNNDQFKKICDVMQLKHLPEDARFKDNASRVNNREILIDILNQRFKQHTSDEWAAMFEGCGFPYGPINSIPQVFSHPQVLHSQLIQTWQHPTAGAVKVAGPAVRYSGFDLSTQCPPPGLGQHTDEVLKNMLNLSNTDIDRLKSSHVIA